MNSTLESIRELISDSKRRRESLELGAKIESNNHLILDKLPIVDPPELIKQSKIDVFGIEIFYDKTFDEIEEIDGGKRGRPRKVKNKCVINNSLKLSRENLDRLYAINTGLLYKKIGISRRVSFLIDFFYTNIQKNKERSFLIKRYIKPITQILEDCRNSSFDSKQKGLLETKYLDLGMILFVSAFDDKDIETFFNKEEKYHLNIAQIIYSNRRKSA